LRENADAIAQSIVLEQGKTLTDAHGDLHRGLQVVQAAANITTTLMGNKIEGNAPSNSHYEISIDLLSFSEVCIRILAAWSRRLMIDTARIWTQRVDDSR
jgi:hypothetical protein